MAYNESSLVKLAQLKQLAQKTKRELDAITQSADLLNSIKYVSVNNNVISFFKSTDGTGTAAFTVNLSEEKFLDQAKTQFVQSFNFASGSYTGATDPNLDGKPVMVLAVAGANNTTTYSFLNMQALVDTYTVKAGDSTKVLDISGYEIEFKLSATAGNALTVNNDGLYVDISGKANKVTNGTENNLMAIDANGHPKDSGVAVADLVTTTSYATNTEVNEMLTEVFDETDSQDTGN